ncbi:C-type lectin domain family 9 member A-like [Fundulus heteroclitus]|uniref:C-type lectin domain family 9 member A-like n=1 Tax=Fundulus heteroclitus TaxID=8078 RepID=UPI00165C2097|nr:C-type lectin domain family 9 member A-like [Fundulus heteroclitus]
MDEQNIYKTSKGEEQADPRFRSLMLCLGTVSILLVASIIIIIRISVVLHRQDVNLKEMMSKMQICGNQTEVLPRDDLTWMLEVILKFDNFPVSEYFVGKKCHPCQKGWIEFHTKCYLFLEGLIYKTWEQSQQYCKNKAADLVTVDNLQEQEFLSNHSTYYYDDHHGYWLGLRKVNIWQWPDGRNNTLRRDAGDGHQPLNDLPEIKQLKMDGSSAPCWFAYVTQVKVCNIE